MTRGGCGIARSRAAGLNVPILLQACNDTFDKVDVKSRRDAFCGKISVANNFYNYGIPFTETTSHTSDLDGEEFEVAFLRSMIRHHRGAIREAEKCLANAEHDELLTLCSDIRDAQLAEIAQMQDWLQEWYDLPGGRPVGTA